MGLIARAFEIAGIPSIVTAWHAGRIRLVNPPRTLITDLPRGTAFGLPGERDRQRAVIAAALALLEKEAPQLPEYFSG